MVNYSDFLNVRKLAFILVVGPVALLMLFATLDLSMHSSKVLKVSEQSCAKLENQSGIQSVNQSVNQNVDCP